ncbi:MAG: hypothetical protein AABY15_01240 [Nanoarchaeota archaeon]
MAKRRARNAKKRVSSQPVALRSTSEKIKIVTKKFITFLVLFAVSYILFKITSEGFWHDLFLLLVLVFGFVALAFFIVWMVLLLMKSMGKQ